MRRFAAGLTILVFMTLAGEVAAQSNGTADPLGLISSAVIQPFWSAGADFTLIELSSPVFFNNDQGLHLVFFNSACARLVSRPIPLTINGIALVDSDLLGVPAGNGLVAIANTRDGFNLVPIPQFPFSPLSVPTFQFSGPLHSRGHWVSFANDHINVVDPIAVGSPETLITAPPLNQQTYSPLRSAATFTNPQNTATTATTIFLICPGALVSSVLPASAGFPAPPPLASRINWVIYDNEEFVFDTFVFCNCLTAVSLSAGQFAGTYLGAPDPQPFSLVPLWYTELFGSSGGSFTGYRGETGSFFFSRLFNASGAALGDPPVLGGR